MLPLPELQRRFGTSLVGREAEMPVRANGLSAIRRLQVYRNNMRINLTEALSAVYPVTRRLVGEEFFAAAAWSYIQAHPSRTGNIQDYGGALPRFLAGYGPASSLPYLSDVAALEWRRLEAALAPPHRPLDVGTLAKVPEERQPGLHFRLQPAARILCSPHPVLSIWEYCQSAAPEGDLDIDRPGECVLLARPGLDVHMRHLEPGEYFFLHHLGRGETFEAACLKALETEPGFDVEQSFTALVQEEILTEFYQ